jgi:hypothetical protein
LLKGLKNLQIFRQMMALGFFLKNINLISVVWNIRAFFNADTYGIQTLNVRDFRALFIKKMNSQAMGHHQPEQERVLF